MPRRVVLGSASPRRLQLLLAAGCDVHVVRPDADESWPDAGPEAAAIMLAERKLALVGPQDCPIITADTIVFAGEPLGKPSDRDAAIAMVRRLAGRRHQVVTGFIVAKGHHRHAEAVSTTVTFRALTDADIERYVDLGESYDKAGGYAIQGGGGALTASVEGSYTNVVGLPLAQVLNALDALS